MFLYYYYYIYIIIYLYLYIYTCIYIYIYKIIIACGSTLFYIHQSFLYSENNNGNVLVACWYRVVTC